MRSTDMNLESYTDEQLLQSLEQEIAKATNELRCLLGDAEKIQARLRFSLVVLHQLKARKD